jgi:hypothetical protein
MPQFEVKNAANQVTITLNGDTADISAGGNGQDGMLVLRDKAGKEYARFTGFQLGGQMVLTTPAGEQRVFLGAAGSDLSLGGNGAGGDINLWAPTDNTGGFPPPTKPNIKMNGGESQVYLRAGGQDRMHLDGSGGNVWLGGNGADGDVVLFAASGDNATLTKSTIHLNGGAGQIGLSTADGIRRILLDGPGGNVWLGGKGEPGDLMLFPETENNNNDHTKASVWLSGHNGDIILKNADCAEEFDVAEADVEPGTVLVLDADAGRLRTSDLAYDTTVAGVVSGAGTYRPGIVLDRHGPAAGRLPVALVGKVFCKVDATATPVRPGSLLTTAECPGHAMAAVDRARAFGAVLGKALQGLESGRGLIPILVALQ